jgi:hypothetical protein
MIYVDKDNDPKISKPAVGTISRCLAVETLNVYTASLYRSHSVGVEGVLKHLSSNV